ncbi:hypothetical protein LUZ61_015794 [Rhynchospora tenuis]|uniref:ENT domain-containing protein n=1 Tax=Rhynchospora tenuis TaxID=198213 RepID=A0AAD5Z4B0_9POAL|nr:hypothetical protein LUZ61_015794 [Rhynchospora tenuis]
MAGTKRLKTKMRFRKGTQVEVFHSGSWRPAEIICGNGHTYLVRYNYCCISFCSDKNTNEEKVLRKVLRPPPPIKEKAGKWAPGDIAEALVHGSWKPVKVTGLAYGNEYYFVSILSQCREVAVKKTNLRQRRVWQNGKWVTIKEESGDVKNSKKRKLSGEACGGISKKLHRKYENDESTESSTGSCSTSGRRYQFWVSSYADDDAVSSFTPIKETSVPEKEMKDQEMEREAHKLEVDAYQATMAALHANGSISWEQEAMLSNLRLLLNISIDEQQSVLRSLSSSK